MEKTNAPNPIFNYAVISLLLLIIFYFIYGLNQQRIEDKRDLYEQAIIQDSLNRELTRSSQERHLLVLRIDSLNSISQTLSTKLTVTKQELSSIKGRYKTWSSDSLAKEMNRRAGQ